MSFRILALLLFLLGSLVFYALDWKANNLPQIKSESIYEYPDSYNEKPTQDSLQSVTESITQTTENNKLISVSLDQALNHDDLYSYALELLEEVGQSQGEAEYLIYRISLYCSISNLETGIEINEFYRSLGVELNLNHFDALERRKTQCSHFNAANDSRLFAKSVDEWLLSSFQQRSQRGIFEFATNRLNDFGSDDLAKKRSYFNQHFKQVIIESLEYTSEFPHQSFGKLISNLGDRTTGHAFILLSCENNSDCTSHSKDNWRTNAVSLCLGEDRDTNCFDTVNLKYLMLFRHSKKEYRDFLLAKEKLRMKLEKASLKQFILQEINIFNSAN